ncbi:hypothetical protein [Burkholderia ubonensis]|uniref:hypothetical protein n=1 Tax=Burkholderia ubonensis TaxID=101571 RepID=UPI0018DFFBF4|nr:hypothetical protein [Burkholderia ubonensis]
MSGSCPDESDQMGFRRKKQMHDGGLSAEGVFVTNQLYQGQGVGQLPVVSERRERLSHVVEIMKEFKRVAVLMILVFSLSSIDT